MVSQTFSDSARNAGVVGAGGAGFPSHIKTASTVEFVIGNGAECEPLLHKDLELMIREPEPVVEGIVLLMKSTGAKHGYIGIKRKYEEKLQALSSGLERAGIKTHWLSDFYPTGDEYVLVYETTRRLIPPKGIPLNVGVVVNNVETLRNLFLATKGVPVTTKYVTVAGAVKTPATFEVPIGASYAHLLAAAGGATSDEFAIFVGGIMMGKLETDMTQPVTKTCAGLVVLPTSHRLIERKSLPVDSMHRIGKSACDQCSYCTEFCPRYLLGYDVQPHKVMRSLSFTATGEQIWNQWADLCCACGLCTLYACPEDLFPKEACDRAKSDLKSRGTQWKGEQPDSPHPMYDGRHIPVKQLMLKLGVTDYDFPAPFKKMSISPTIVRIPLSQHIGSPAVPVVAKGKKVKTGDVIADIPDGKLGARVHASIDGIVTAINDEIIIDQR